MRNLFVLKGNDFAAAVFLFEDPLSFYVFVFGWARNCWGSESGHMQTVTVLQYMVFKMPQQIPPIHTLYTQTVYIYLVTGGGGIVEL